MVAVVVGPALISPGGHHNQVLRTGPLQHSKMPRTPNLFKICPDNCFLGFQSGGLKFVKNLSNIENLSGNWRFDKFLTNLGRGNLNGA